MSLASFLVSYLNLARSYRLRYLSIRPSFMDVSGLVSEPCSQLPFETPVDQTKLRACFYSRCGIGSEGSFAMPVDQIQLRGRFWLRF